MILYFLGEHGTHVPVIYDSRTLRPFTFLWADLFVNKGPSAYLGGCLLSPFKKSWVYHCPDYNISWKAKWAFWLFSVNRV